MREKLADFDDHRLALQSLVYDLEALIASLEEEADPDWIEELRSAWWRFEFVNAMAIDQERELTARDHEELREASHELQSMLND